MGLKDVLQKHKIPLGPEFDERMDIVISGLRRAPGYKQKLESYGKRKTGGDIPGIPMKLDNEDFLGPRLRWFVQAMGSPFAQTVVRSLFMIIFFTSYLENIPIFGSVLSAVLDIMVAGGKIITKTVQKNIPPIIGLIPLPYASLFGMVLASIFGMIVWPVIAIVSFSRQDFTAGIEAFLRVIPPPIGDTIADLFLEGNRMVARIDQKRIKLGNDISKGIELVSSIVSGVSSEMKQGASSLATQTKDAAKSGLQTVKETFKDTQIPKVPTMPTPTMPTVPTIPTPTMPTMPTIPTPTMPTMPTIPTPPTLKGGKRLSRRKHMKNKWRNKTLRRK